MNRKKERRIEPVRRDGKVESIMSPIFIFQISKEQSKNREEEKQKGRYRR